MTLQAFLRPGGSMFMFRGPGGPKEPQSVPMLRWVGTYPLVDSAPEPVDGVAED